MATQDALPYEQTDWNKEVEDNDKVLDATDFEDEIPYSDGEVWTGKSISEMKTLLGIPKKYSAIVTCSGSDPTVVVVKNTTGLTFTLTRLTTGVITVTPSGSTVSATNTMVTLTPQSGTVIGASVQVISYGGAIQIYCLDVDGAASDAVNFFIDLEIYE